MKTITCFSLLFICTFTSLASHAGGGGFSCATVDSDVLPIVASEQISNCKITNLDAVVDELAELKMTDPPDVRSIEKPKKIIEVSCDLGDDRSIRNLKISPLEKTWSVTKELVKNYIIKEKSKYPSEREKRKQNEPLLQHKANLKAAIENIPFSKLKDDLEFAYRSRCKSTGLDDPEPVKNKIFPKSNATAAPEEEPSVTQ